MAAESRVVVIDASVTVKWFVPEVDTEDALRLREGHANGSLSLFAPALLIYEVANALRYRPDITEADLKDDIYAIFSLDMTLVNPSSSSTANTASKARCLNITAYDAVYLELAEELGCQLITADEELYQKTEKTRLVTLLKDYQQE